MLEGLAIAILMVPVVMALILGMIYGLGEIFNVISKVGHRDRQADRPVKNHQ